MLNDYFARQFSTLHVMQLHKFGEGKGISDHSNFCSFRVTKHIVCKTVLSFIFSVRRNSLLCICIWRRQRFYKTF